MVSNNPLLAGIPKIPGFSITLPSKALTYDESIVDQSVLTSGEVHVRPMSIKDEMTLKTPDLLISGEGICTVIKRCVDGVKEPLYMSIGDINAILLALRIVTFGDKMPVSVLNPYYDKELLGSMKRIDFNIDLKWCLANAKNAENKDLFSIKLDNGQLVKLQQMTFHDTLDFLKFDLTSEQKALETDEQKNEYLKTKLINAFVSVIKMIISVTTSDGIEIEDAVMITEWYEGIHNSTFEPLKERLDLISTLGPQMELELFDPITKNKFKIEVPVNPTDFFVNGKGRVIEIN